MLDINFLDEDQQAAVRVPFGVTKVDAGAGTGKTTTFTYKIMHLIDEEGLFPSSIVAVTFTNKAAREIKDRLEALIGEDASQVRMGTFHGLCLRMLRKHYTLAGLQSPSFMPADDDEAKELMNRAVENSGVLGKFEAAPQAADESDAVYKARVKADEKEYAKRLKLYQKEAYEQISRWKECGLHIEDALAGLDDADQGRKEFILIYSEYQDLLSERNLLDFSDLILRMVYILEKYPDIAEQESKKIRYMLVDEFQDVNMLQWRLIRALTAYHGNIFGVGDFDQSLYSFRASAPQIFDLLGEIADHHITLKTNRRCTQSILDTANMLVDVNSRKTPKVLNSNREGAGFEYKNAANEFAEAKMVAQYVKDRLAEGVSEDQIAVIVRSRFLFSPIEKEMIKAGIPYTLLGSNSILETIEIKDILSFLKLAVDPYNDIAFSRIANKPVRGLGPTALNEIVTYANSEFIPMYDACMALADGTSGRVVRKNTRTGMIEISNVLSCLRDGFECELSPVELIEILLKESGYQAYLETLDGTSRREKNIAFLLEVASGFSDLVEFLQEFSLLTDMQESGEGVGLLTIHASKGLEFDYTVFPGWSKGTFPSEKALVETPGDINDPWMGPPIGGVEEERRVAHVALTRSRFGGLVLSTTKRGKMQAGPSPFLFLCGLKKKDVSYQDGDFSYVQNSKPFKRKKIVRRLSSRTPKAPTNSL